MYQFAGIIGDFNELHINQPAAEESLFKSRVVHGCLADSLVSTVLGMKYPGKGTIFLEKSVSYIKPVYIGDTVTVEITAAEKREKGRVLFDVSYHNQDGTEAVSYTHLDVYKRQGESGLSHGGGRARPAASCRAEAEESQYFFT